MCSRLVKQFYILRVAVIKVRKEKEQFLNVSIN